MYRYGFGIKNLENNVSIDRAKTYMILCLLSTFIFKIVVKSNIETYTSKNTSGLQIKLVVSISGVVKTS